LDGNEEKRICENCVAFKETKDWYRDWHRIERKEVKDKKVYRSGEWCQAMKPVHFFVCARCNCDKLKDQYNYEQAENAINKRIQPTCSACIPELPMHVDKLRVSEMKTYMREWMCSPVKTGAKKKEVLSVFRKHCKRRLQENFFRHRRNKDTGVKVASKPRSLELLYKEWRTKQLPALRPVTNKIFPPKLARAQDRIASIAPPVAAPARQLSTKPATAQLIDLYRLDSDSEEEFEFDPPNSAEERAQPIITRNRDLSQSQDQHSYRSEELDLSSQQLQELTANIMARCNPDSSSSSVPTAVQVPMPPAVLRQASNNAKTIITEKAHVAKVGQAVPRNQYGDEEESVEEEDYAHWDARYFCPYMSD
jgi:hypothetical protein